jgi:hypothetical protein
VPQLAFFRNQNLAKLSTGVSNNMTLSILLNRKIKFLIDLNFYGYGIYKGQILDRGLLELPKKTCQYSATFEYTLFNC